MFTYMYIETILYPKISCGQLSKHTHTHATLIQFTQPLRSGRI